MTSEEKTPTAYLICGFLGAGKTTLAKKLAKEHGAVRFSVDEHYLELFSDGPTFELDVEAMKRVLSSLELLWPQVLQTGNDVVLDFGFWRKELRDKVRAQVERNGARARLLLVRCPDAVALSRCQERNGQPGAFLISAQGFSDLRGHFEEPSPDEIDEVIDSDQA